MATHFFARTVYKCGSGLILYKIILACSQLDRGPIYPSLLEVHNLIFPYVYKYKPTYGLSPADFSTHETKDQNGMTLLRLTLIPRHITEKLEVVWRQD